MDNAVTAFEHSCVKQVLERLQSFLLLDFFNTLKEQHVQHSQVLSTFRAAVLDSSILASFLMKLLPCEKELEVDLVKRKKSLRKFAKVFDLPLGLRVSLVNKCSALVCAWKTWSIVEGGIEVDSAGGGGAGGGHGGVKCGDVNVRLEHTAVVLGNHLSSLPFSSSQVLLGGHSNKLEVFEAFSPAWGSQPLTLLVYNDPPPQGLLSNDLNWMTQEPESEFESDLSRRSTLSVQSFLRLCLQWLKCGVPDIDKNHHYQHHQTGQHKGQHKGHVSTAYFLRYIQHCWCLVIAPNNSTQTSIMNPPRQLQAQVGQQTPSNNTPLLNRSPMQNRQDKSVSTSSSSSTSTSTVSLTLEAFLTQGIAEVVKLFFVVIIIIDTDMTIDTPW